MPVETIGAPLVLPDGRELPFSLATRAAGLIFVSGHMGVDESLSVVEGGIAAQTRQTLRNIEAVLNIAGAELKHVVKVLIWLTDLGDFHAMNDAYQDVFGDHRPARSTVLSPKLALPGALVEIELVAVDPSA